MKNDNLTSLIIIITINLILILFEISESIDYSLIKQNGVVFN
jgi:hypothetical protein